MLFTRSAPEFISGALLFLALLSGCSFPERADLRIVNGKEPETLDPASVVGQADGRVVQSLFEGLTRYNATNAAPEPGLADRWELSPDARIYTFHIRTNAQWSTGEPITARDFVYSWFRVLAPETAADYAGNLFYIKGAEDFNSGRNQDRDKVGLHALDDRTLQVELIYPTPFFLDLCAFPTLAVVHRGTIEKYGDRWLKARPLPASGAYELESWRLNDRIRLRKNPQYWEPDTGRIEVIDLFPVTSATTALNLYLKKEVDILWDKEVVPSELVDVLIHRRDFHRFDYLANYFFRYNVTRKPFNDPRVRQALALVIDREPIVRYVTRGGEKAAHNLIPAGLPNYQPAAGLPRDPDRARALLAEAGYPGGKGFPRFQYLFNTSRDHEKIALQLQQTWKKELGINVELKAVEWKVYLKAQSSLDYDLCRSSWIGDYTDPNTFLDLWMSQNPNNRTGWKNQHYDELLRAANSTANLVQRATLLRQAEAILIREDLPIVPLYFYVGFNFFDPEKITGIFNDSNLRDVHPLRAIRRVKPGAGRAASKNP